MTTNTTLRTAAEQQGAMDDDDVKCVNAHDRCYGGAGGPCPYCERTALAPDNGLVEKLRAMDGNGGRQVNHAELIARLERLTKPSNEIDILVEIALFEPDELHKSVRANAARTKVIFTTAGGRDETYWAHDYTLSKDARAKCIAALRALDQHHD